MNVENVSTQSFGGFRITKSAQRIVTDMFQGELKAANDLYMSRLAQKHAKKPNFKSYHDEKLFQRCFDNAWNKMDMYDSVIIDYSRSSSKDMMIKTVGDKLAVDTFSNATGERVKVSEDVFDSKIDFLKYFSNEFFHGLKRNR